MSLAFMLLVQAAAATAAPAPPPGLPRIDFDLARYRPSDEGSGSCQGAEASAEEVVVCGRRRQSGAFPLAQWARVFASRPLLAEIGIVGNVRGDMHVESVAMDRGAVSNRVMLRVTLPF